MAREITAADFHRNGISGDGFYVGIFTDDDGSRKLVVSFPDIGQCAVAVLDLDEAAKGNIYMHPHHDKDGTGGNAWRGDNYQDVADKLPLVVSADFAELSKKWRL